MVDPEFTNFMVHMVIVCCISGVIGALISNLFFW